MGLVCFICSVELEDVRYSRLLRHAEQVHQYESISFTCNEAGCWGIDVGVVPAVTAVAHYCSHFTARHLQDGSLEEDDDDDDDEFAGDEVAREAYLEAEEELHPTGDMLDSWLLDDTAQDDTSLQEFANPPKRLSVDEEKQFEFLAYCVKHSLTHQAQKDLFNLKIFTGSIPNIPTAETLKRRAWSYLSQIGLDVIDLSGGQYKEPVPFFSLKKSIRSWLLHPYLSRVIVDVSDSRTLPFAHDIFLSDTPLVFSPEVFSTMADGTEWLEPLRRTKDLWYPTYLRAIANDEKVLFLHVLLFGDGLPLWKLRQQSFEVITSTLGEFDEGMRSSFNSPAIQVNTMASKEIVQNFFRGYDGVLKAFQPDFDDLIKGERFWCECLGKSVTVIAAFHGLEGDLPARCQAGGFKKPSGNTYSDCHCCEGTKGGMKEQIVKGVVPQLREMESLKGRIDMIMGTGNKIVKEALSYEHGVTRRSALWNYPGACLNRQLLGELMHCEAEGELPKHFALLIPKFLLSDSEFFLKLDQRTRGYFRSIGISFPSIATFQKWRWHTNAADRLRFCLHSLHLLSPFVTETLKKDFALWKVHVIFAQLLTRHNVTKEEVQMIRVLPFTIQRGMINLYGEDVLTPNSHWTFHFCLYIEWFSVMRLYWTFPQESLLHKMKNITKKTSNHRSTSYSCVRLFVLDRQLNLIFHPMDHIPKKTEIDMGVKTTVDRLPLAAADFIALGVQVHDRTEAFANCKLIKNYQSYSANSVCATPSGLKVINDLIAVEGQGVLFALVQSLFPNGYNKHGLPKFQRSPVIFLEKECFQYLCWGAWEEGEFVLVVEDK